MPDHGRRWVGHLNRTALRHVSGELFDLRTEGGRERSLPMILMNILLQTFGNKNKHSRGPMPHDFQTAAGWKPFFGSTAPSPRTTVGNRKLGGPNPN